ncbi:CHAT domain-containing protein [Kovacikia minuta CCNUW1]|uniref:CHAT domain-containing protein n=1 Tax=Kovacikia minuta TaxID=2931930 RepID=UPI001CCA4618|nr:CHAT domain-containing protein [Kovacikia minuta]UBF24988.1 CHAT domain-containing protein [Kovacikia minuta CCNUW1]
MPTASNPPQTILFLAANPRDTVRLRLDQELRDVAEGLQRSRQRDQFRLEQRLAVRPRDIQRAMLDVGPQLVHFSGHGAGAEGLYFEDEGDNAKLVSGDALAGLFALFADQIHCVLLNGCYSEVQAQAIAHHVDYVIGMNQSIGDRAAIEFAVGFYDALGAGRSIDFAYQLGCNAIHLAGIPEHLTPVLLKKTPTPISPTSPTSPLSHSPPPPSPTPHLPHLPPLPLHLLLPQRRRVAGRVGCASC